MDEEKYNKKTNIPRKTEEDKKKYSQVYYQQNKEWLNNLFKEWKKKNQDYYVEYYRTHKRKSEKVQCGDCLKYYASTYFELHKCKPKKFDENVQDFSQ